MWNEQEGAADENAGIFVGREDTSPPVLGWTLQVSLGPDHPTDPEKHVTGPISTDRTLLDDVVAKSRVSEQAFRDELPTSPDIRGFFDGLSSGEKARVRDGTSWL